MMEHGIKVNMDKLSHLRFKLTNSIEETLDKVLIKVRETSPIGDNFNEKICNSSKQIREYFESIKAPQYKKKGKITYDSDALKRLARKGYEVATLINKFRKDKKILSSYLTEEKFDDDERIRSSYNPVGTRFSRASSSESIFGTGMNMQNWPGELLEILLPDPGYICVRMDYSQIENRIVALLSRDSTMLDAFNLGKDVHSLTGAYLSGKDYDQIIEDHHNKVKAPLGDGSKTWRDWGKRANHGLNYDLGFKQFALYYEIPEKQAKGLIDGYHTLYPGVRQNFHSYVKYSILKSGYTKTLMGRKIYFFSNPTDETFKAGYASIPQGTCGDMINKHGVLYVYETYPEADLLMQVHDDITFQLPLNIGFEKIAEIILKIKQEMESPLYFQGSELIVPVDTVVTPSLSKYEGVEFTSTAVESANFHQELEKICESFQIL